MPKRDRLALVAEQGTRRQHGACAKRAASRPHAAYNPTSRVTAIMGERAKMCEERIAEIAAADGNPYKVLRVTEAATQAEIKKAYHKTVLLVRECAAIERDMCM